jgi:hypothetical protein
VSSSGGRLSAACTVGGVTLEALSVPSSRVGSESSKGGSVSSRGGRVSGRGGRVSGRSGRVSSRGGSISSRSGRFMAALSVELTSKLCECHSFPSGEILTKVGSSSYSL